MSSVLILEATRDREAVGRGVLATAAAIVVCGALAISHLGRIAGEVTEPPAGHYLSFPFGRDGHCHVDGRIDGTLLRGMLLDSGSSGYLTAGKNQAADVGVDVGKLAFNRRYDSANGFGKYAMVNVRELRIDGFVMRDVPVEVTEVKQSQVLVGIEILKTLKFRLDRGRCELSWS